MNFKLRLIEDYSKINGVVNLDVKAGLKYFSDKVLSSVASCWNLAKDKANGLKTLIENRSVVYSELVDVLSESIQDYDVTGDDKPGTIAELKNRSYETSPSVIQRVRDFFATINDRFTIVNDQGQPAPLSLVEGAINDGDEEIKPLLVVTAQDEPDIELGQVMIFEQDGKYYVHPNCWYGPTQIVFPKKEDIMEYWTTIGLWFGIVRTDSIDSVLHVIYDDFPALGEKPKDIIASIKNIILFDDKYAIIPNSLDAMSRMCMTAVNKMIWNYRKAGGYYVRLADYIASIARLDTVNEMYARICGLLNVEKVDISAVSAIIDEYSNSAIPDVSNVISGLKDSLVSSGPSGAIQFIQNSIADLTDPTIVDEEDNPHLELSDNAAFATKTYMASFISGAVNALATVANTALLVINPVIGVITTIFTTIVGTIVNAVTNKVDDEENIKYNENAQFDGFSYSLGRGVIPKASLPYQSICVDLLDTYESIVLPLPWGFAVIRKAGKEEDGLIVLEEHLSAKMTSFGDLPNLFFTNFSREPHEILGEDYYDIGYQYSPCRYVLTDKFVSSEIVKDKLFGTLGDDTTKTRVPYYQVILRNACLRYGFETSINVKTNEVSARKNRYPIDPVTSPSSLARICGSYNLYLDHLEEKDERPLSTKWGLWALQVSSTIRELCLFFYHANINTPMKLGALITGNCPEGAMDSRYYQWYGLGTALYLLYRYGKYLHDNPGFDGSYYQGKDFLEYVLKVPKASWGCGEGDLQNITWENNTMSFIADTWLEASTPYSAIKDNKIAGTCADLHITPFYSELNYYDPNAPRLTAYYFDVDHKPDIVKYQNCYQLEIFGYSNNEQGLCIPNFYSQLPYGVNFSKMDFSVTPPVKAPGSFLKFLVISSVITAAAAAVTLVVAVKVKRKIQEKRFKLNAAAEKAWYKYTDDAKTPEEKDAAYQEYRKSVRKNNLFASIFGGTKFSKSGIYDDPSENVSFIDSLQEKLDDIQESADEAAESSPANIAELITGVPSNKRT